MQKLKSTEWEFEIPFQALEHNTNAKPQKMRWNIAEW